MFQDKSVPMFRNKNVKLFPEKFAKTNVLTLGGVKNVHMNKSLLYLLL